MAKVVFYQRVVFAYFGVMSISAVLKKHGHKVDLVMSTDIKKAVNDILSLDPDVVGFSALTGTGEFEWSVKAAGMIKENRPSTLIVFGGMHSTIFPDESMENTAIDIICRGEGEYAMLDLCNRIDNCRDFSRIPNLWVRTPKGIVRNEIGRLIEDLDELPFPDRDLYAKYNYFKGIWSVDVLAGRQCPFDCSFCYNHVLKEIYRGKGRFVRKHSVDYVVRELEDINRRFKPKSVTFQDELFVLYKTWLREFAEKYRKAIELPFICSVRADMMDEESAVLLKESGASTVCLGIESGNERVRNVILKKQITDNQLENAVRLLHKHKIKFLTANILGIPGETIENAYETIEMNQRFKTDYLYFSLLQPYPKLDITKQAESLGLIRKLKPAEFYSTFFRRPMLRSKDNCQFINLHKLAYIATAFPWLKFIVRKIIKLPPNPFFDIIFMLGFANMQFSCFKKNWRQLFLVGFKNINIFYSNGHMALAKRTKKL